MKKYLAGGMIVFCTLTSVSCLWANEGTGELGLGYGKQCNDDPDLYQVEGYWRQALPFEKLGDGWVLKTKLEIAGAYLAEGGGGDAATMRFSLMPQLYLERGFFRVFAGFGTGFMVGDTEFTDHNLGGEFLLNSKVGVQLVFNDKFGLELNYYHQSNAGIYEYNASLNMAMVSLAWHL